MELLNQDKMDKTNKLWTKYMVLNCKCNLFRSLKSESFCEIGKQIENHYYSRLVAFQCLSNLNVL